VTIINGIKKKSNSLTTSFIKEKREKYNQLFLLNRFKEINYLIKTQ